MEGLQIYPITKLCYKLQDHVLGVEIGREDFGVKLVFTVLNNISTFLVFTFIALHDYPLKHEHAK